MSTECANLNKFDIRKSDFNPKGSNNIQNTKGLFMEYGNPDAPYSLRPEHYEKDGRWYISMYQVYMDSVDEYDAAMRIVGSQRHWRKLCTIKWFTDGVDMFSHEGLNQWREDMRARDESLAKAKLMELADKGNANAASKLMDKAKVVNTPKGVGRPGKQQAAVTLEEDDIFAGFSKAQQGSSYVS
jgi:hypothetical protein